MSQPGKKGLRSSSPRRTESPIRTSASPSIKRPVSGRPSLGAGPKTPGKVPIPPSVSSPKTSPRRFQSAGAALKSPSPISYAAHRMAKVGGSMVPSPPRSSSDSPNQLESRLSFNNPARLRAYASADDAANVDVKPSTSSGSRSVVRVVIRCRPLNAAELADGQEPIVAAGDDPTSLCVACEGQGGRQVSKVFKFPRVVGPLASQTELFESSGVKSLLDSALNGYAATILAYGQTGSGKTFTMSGYDSGGSGASTASGSSGMEGIIPRSARYLFHKISMGHVGGEGTTPGPKITKTKVMCTFCEVYNENVYDLLNLSNDNHAVRWNAKLKKFTVPDLLSVECNTVDELMTVVAEGLRNRTIGSTAMNKDSSRSHSLLTVYIESQLEDPTDGFKSRRHGKLVFVDLAGSEREAHSGVQGEAAKETRNINLSLLCLGKVITTLATLKSGGLGPTPPSTAGGRKGLTVSAPVASGPAAPHIPYRDSKLTKLLMDSLGGTALTLMIACISPLQRSLEDTLNTLNYAMRASNIKNKPTIQLDETELLILNLRKEVAFLRKENQFLQEKLEGAVELPAGGVSPSSSSSVTATPSPVLPPPAEQAQRTRVVPLLIPFQRKSSDATDMIKAQKEEIDRLRAELAKQQESRVNDIEESRSVMDENEVLSARLEKAEDSVREYEKEVKALKEQITALQSAAAATPTIPGGKDHRRSCDSLLPAKKRLSEVVASSPLSRTSVSDARRISSESKPALDIIAIGTSADLQAEVDRLREALANALRRNAELQNVVKESKFGPVVNAKSFRDVLGASRELFHVKQDIATRSVQLLSSSLPSTGSPMPEFGKSMSAGTPLSPTKRSTAHPSVNTSPYASPYASPVPSPQRPSPNRLGIVVPKQESFESVTSLDENALTEAFIQPDYSPTSPLGGGHPSVKTKPSAATSPGDGNELVDPFIISKSTTATSSGGRDLVGVFGKPKSSAASSSGAKSKPSAASSSGGSKNMVDPFIVPKPSAATSPSGSDLVGVFGKPSLSVSSGGGSNPGVKPKPSVPSPSPMPSLAVSSVEGDEDNEYYSDDDFIPG